METKLKGKVEVCDGNKTTAYSALVCNPDVIGVFPITPQTTVGEYICGFKADGLLDAEIVEAECEITSMGSIIGASAAGGRVFTSSSSMGLNFMFDTYLMAGLSRLPVVMINSNREQSPPAVVAAGQQDIMGVADAGWIHIHTENCQEILDSTIMAYKLAEDSEILIPVTVCYDGFYLSYLSEAIEIPSQEVVDSFLPRRPRPVLGFNPPMSLGVLTIGDAEMAELRYRHQAAFERAKDKIEQIDKDFAAVFGRSYGGLIEEYKMEDAEIAIVSLGSHTGTARVAIDKKREEGTKVGLVKVRAFRPFPQERLVQALRGKKAIGVIDRSVCFGWRGGHLYRELRAALYGLGIPIADFIAGLGGHDITIPLIEKVVDITYQASQGKPFSEVTWLAME